MSDGTCLEFTIQRLSLLPLDVGVGGGRLGGDEGEPQSVSVWAVGAPPLISRLAPLIWGFVCDSWRDVCIVLRGNI